MNRSIPKHANFFVFADGLRCFESRKSDNAVHDKPSVNLITPKHKKDRERDEKIRFFTKLICNGSISTEQFLQGMACSDQCTYESFSDKMSIQTFEPYPSIHISIHPYIHPFDLLIHKTHTHFNSIHPSIRPIIYSGTLGNRSITYNLNFFYFIR